MTFIDFATDSVRRAGAVGYLPGGKNIQYPQNMYVFYTLFLLLFLCLFFSTTESIIHVSFIGLLN